MISLQISDEQAERFAEVYKEEYGEDMTIPEARAAIQDVLPYALTKFQEKIESG